MYGVVLPTPPALNVFEPGCSIKNAKEGTDLLSQGLLGETNASSGNVIIPPSMAEMWT
jgi:hypothetical protein